MYLYLIIGIVALLVLPYSVNTYLAYAEEGYGVEATIIDAKPGSMSSLILTFEFRNPGMLDLQIENVSTYLFAGTPGLDYYPRWTELPLELPRKESVVHEFIFSLNMTQYGLIISNGSLDMELEFTIFVPERDAWTTLRFSGIAEVETGG